MFCLHRELDTLGWHLTQPVSELSGAQLQQQLREEEEHQVCEYHPASGLAVLLMVAKDWLCLPGIHRADLAGRRLHLFLQRTELILLFFFFWLLLFYFVCLFVCFLSFLKEKWGKCRTSSRLHLLALCCSDSLLRWQSRFGACRLWRQFKDSSPTFPTSMFAVRTHGLWECEGQAPLLLKLGH